MSAPTCGHPDHEAQDEKRAYEPGWEAAHHHKIIHGHSPVPAPTAVDLTRPDAPISRKVGTDGLTIRQRQILTFRAAGLTQTQIGIRLGIKGTSVGTIIGRLRRAGHLEATR